MKKLVAIVLCTALIWTSGSMELYAAPEAVEENVEVTEVLEETAEEEIPEVAEEEVEEEIPEVAEEEVEEEIPKVTEEEAEEEIPKVAEEEAEEEIPEVTEEEAEEEVPEVTKEEAEEEILEEPAEKAIVKEEKTGITAGVTLKGTAEVAAMGATLTEKSVTATAGCTAADLQALLDLNAAGQYKLTVNIPAGTYQLTRSLYVYPNTTIKASGSAKLIKQSKYGAMIEAKLTADDGGYDGNHDITIDGGIWDTTPLMNDAEGTETFRFIHCNNIIIKNATLCNVPEGSHLIVFAGVQNGTITNCRFYGYGDNGDNEITPKEAVQLDTAHSEVQVPTNQGDQITWDDLPCDKIMISGCEFYDFSRGIGSHTAVAGRIHSNVTIKNNNFHDLSDSAIRLYNYKDTVVTGNTIKNAEEGILVYTYMEDAEKDSYFAPLNGKIGALPSNYNITISQNTITNIKDTDKVWGDGIRVIGKSNRPMAGVKISGNTITSMSRYGIFATAAPNLTVGTGNKITTTANHAILLEQESSNSNIYGNTISGAKNGGIAVYSSENITIYSNTVSSVYTAIYLLDAVKCTVGKDSNTGNTVTSSKENGITLSTNPAQKNGTGCTSTKVQYNTVKSAKTNGIFVYKTKSAYINKNTVTTAGESGILVTTGSTSAKVIYNTISAAKENGISITLASKYAQVTGNKVLKYGTANKDGKRYGIMIYQSGGSSKTNTKVLKNSITGTGTVKKKNGIQISSSSYITVSGNTVTKPDGVGIYGYKAQYCTIGVSKSDYNTIKNSTETGIYLTTACDSSKVLYNKVSGVAADGIGAYTSTKLTISGNTVSAKGSGIYITTKCSSSKISNNIVNSAGNHGVGVATNCKNVTITGNTIKKYSASKADGSGIYVYQSGGTSSKSRTKVTKNNITGTGKSTKKNGIKVSEASYTTIESNTVTAAAGAGVYVYKSKNCIINKNTVKSPKTLGITVTTNCDGAKVTSNTVSKAGDTSINLYKAPKSTVSLNTVTTTKKYRGIWVSTSSKTTITSNKVIGAKKSEEILVTSSSGCKKSKNIIK